MADPATAAPPGGTQCDRLLGVLVDGRWHTAAELLQQVPCVVHSRIAELRKRGYPIEHETRGHGAAGSVYRLVDQTVLFPTSTRR